MKVDFDKYVYFDATSKDKKSYTANNAPNGVTAFDIDAFQDLINQRRYEEAYEMGSKYHFKDPETEKNFKLELTNIRHQGRIINSCYAKIPEGDDRDEVEFADNVFNNLNSLSDNNRYKAKFSKTLRSLGSSYNGNNIDKEAQSLDVKFTPAKRYGWFGLDWLAADNEDTIDNFYKQSGLTKQDLKANGIDVIEKDGNTILHFDKSNPLAIKILYNVPKPNTVNNIAITGYDENGKQIVGNNVKSTTKAVQGWTSSNRGFAGGSSQTLMDIASIKTSIDRALEHKDEYFRKNDLAEKVYTSMKGGMLFDNLESLKQDYEKGEINDTQFNKELNLRYKNILSQLKSINLIDREIYSNMDNGPEIGDEQETLNPITEQDRRNAVINLISATDLKNMNLQSMISNGKIGTLITINAKKKQSSANKTLDFIDDADENTFEKRYQIFIPGLFHEEAQKKINSNNLTRTAQELNAMQDYDYEYKTLDGKTIMPSGHGDFYINNQRVSKDEAYNTIAKDMVVEDALNNLQFQYLNHQGNLIDEDAYDNMAKMMAIKASEELHQGVPNIKSDGSPLTLDDIFGHRGVKSMFNNDFDKMINWQLYDKIADIFEIYDAIMDGITYYKQ